ncbi:MAG: GNAT family N-acetyltransferase [Nitrospirae bacterium]|nr:GNAT family N-acetyltransferase [Nitrospirota bacterium]MBI3351365.1 GNAT family N-acetyltransferase [Nitrospirota bacterium]
MGPYRRIRTMTRIISRLETPRLYLELINDDDPRALLSSCLTPFFPWRSEAQLQETAVHRLLFYTSPNPPSNYKVTLKELHKKIGIIGFFKWDPQEKTGTIGFSIDKLFRNQGLMTEACSAFIDAWFDRGKMEWIEGKCQPDNFASEKVLIRSGMKKIKTVEEPLFKESRLYTLHVYGISRPEWQILKCRKTSSRTSPEVQG